MKRHRVPKGLNFERFDLDIAAPDGAGICFVAGSVCY
jgi:hypothetical protein